MVKSKLEGGWGVGRGREYINVVVQYIRTQAKYV